MDAIGGGGTQPVETGHAAFQLCGLSAEVHRQNELHRWVYRLQVTAQASRDPGQQWMRITDTRSIVNYKLCLLVCIQGFTRSGVYRVYLRKLCIPTYQVHDISTACEMSTLWWSSPRCSSCKLDQIWPAELTKSTHYLHYSFALCFFLLWVLCLCLYGK